MTRFEEMLKNAKSREEIINMQDCCVDHLTEDECIALKAKYAGLSEDSVRFMIAGRNAVREHHEKRNVEEAFKIVVNLVSN